MSKAQGRVKDDETIFISSGDDEDAKAPSKKARAEEVVDERSEPPPPSPLPSPPLIATPRGWRPVSQRRFILKWKHMVRPDGPLWAMALMPNQGTELLAVTCGTAIRTFQLDIRSREPKTLLQTVISEGEDFYSLAWLQCSSCPTSTRTHATLPTAVDGNATLLLLAAAGLKGVIRLIDVARGKFHADLFGHGSEVFTLATHPLLRSVLASGSRDNSVRLWDANTRTCLVVLQGHRGHSQPVTCLTWSYLDRLSHDDQHQPSSEGDVQRTKSYLISGAMDQRVCIWDVFAPLYERKKHAKTQVVHSPIFSAHRLHDNYIDDVHCWDSTILTRSCDNRLILWEPIPRAGHRADGSILHRREFDLGRPECAAPWGMKTAVAANLIIGGTVDGSILIWDRFVRPPIPRSELLDRPEAPALTLAPPRDESGAKAVRVLACEEDGRYIVCGNDAGLMCLYADADEAL